MTSGDVDSRHQPKPPATFVAGPDGMGIMNQDDLPRMTTEEAAALIGVPVSTMAYWRRENIGPKYYKIGRLIRYVRAELLAWMGGCQS